MKISDFLFLLRRETKQNIKIGLLITLQMIFIFLSGAFLFIAQNAINNGMYTYLNRQIEKKEYIVFGINANFMYYEEFKNMDATYVIPVEKAGEAKCKNESIQYLTYSIIDEKEQPVRYFNGQCTYGKQELIYINKIAASKLGLQKGDEVEADISEKKVNLTIDEIFEDELETPCVYIPYAGYITYEKNTQTTFEFGFDNAENLFETRNRLSKDGYKINFALDEYLNTINLIRGMVIGLFVVIALMGFNNFRNMCSILIKKRYPFFIRGKMCGIKTRDIILPYPILLQLIISMVTAGCIPICRAFIKAANYAASAIVNTEVVSEVEIIDYIGIIITFVVGSLILWIKWIAFEIRLNREALANKTDIKE